MEWSIGIFDMQVLCSFEPDNGRVCLARQRSRLTLGQEVSHVYKAAVLIDKDDLPSLFFYRRRLDCVAHAKVHSQRR